MTNGAVEKLPMAIAVDVIQELKSFPIALWSLENHERYAHAFYVFWMGRPSKDVFDELMLGAPLTPQVVWTMMYGYR